MGSISFSSIYLKSHDKNQQISSSMRDISFKLFGESI